jgi:hypothetical protein
MPAEKFNSAEASDPLAPLTGGGDRGGYQTVLERESEQPASANSNSASQLRARIAPRKHPVSIGRLRAIKEAAPSWDRHCKYSRQLQKKRPGEPRFSTNFGL